MITGKIDLAKIGGVKLLEKDGRTFLEITNAKLFAGKNGARYLDLTLWETPGGQYGDWRITQDLGKEARASGEKGAILGNGTNRGTGQTSAPPKRPSAPPPREEIDPDSVPF
jgi:hypothetical protein